MSLQKWWSLCLLQKIHQVHWCWWWWCNNNNNYDVDSLQRCLSHWQIALARFVSDALNRADCNDTLHRSIFRLALEYHNQQFATFVSHVNHFGHWACVWAIIAKQQKNLPFQNSAWLLLLLHHRSCRFKLLLHLNSSFMLDQFGSDALYLQKYCIIFCLERVAFANTKSRDVRHKN